MGERTSRSRAFRGYAGFYACSFLLLGAYMQFFPTWLHEVGGFGEAHVTVILSAQKIARTLAGPLWSSWVDRCGDARRVLLLLATGGLGAFLLFWFAEGLLFAWCVAFLFGSLGPPMFPIVDAASVQAAQQHGFSFGRLRMIGSVTFLLAILLVGAWLERFGTPHVFPILAVALLLTIAAAWFVPRGEVDAAAVGQRERTPWWRLFQSRSFVLVLLAASLIQGSHALYYDLSTVHWNEHGIDKTMAAVLWGEGVLAEIVLLFYARQTFDRLRPTTLLLLGGLCAVVRWTLIGVTTSLPLLLLGNWLHAFSFAATYLGGIRALHDRVPAHQHATAQGVLGAATSGFGMAACGLLGGFAYRHLQGAAFYLMAGVALLGACCALLLRRGPRGLRPSRGAGA